MILAMRKVRVVFKHLSWLLLPALLWSPICAVADNLAPEAQRFEAERVRLNRGELLQYILAMKRRGEKAWRQIKTPAQGKLRVTKIEVSLAPEASPVCKVLSPSGLDTEDEMVKATINAMRFDPPPPGITNVKLYWTLMTDGTLNVLELSESPEADLYNTSLLGGRITHDGQLLIAGRPAAFTMTAPVVERRTDFAPYITDLQRRIKRAWFPPRGNEFKHVVVQFTVGSGGELSGLRLDQSSGLAIADQAALKAIENAAPFRPLPAGAPDDIKLRVVFDYSPLSSEVRADLL